mmetsp:Transcript_19174/g.32106  ORF Transcript_19174/g.32106 Transcript_19174/m.32106 type:complete len:220 (-) Transcript_19174:553-1212(-)
MPTCALLFTAYLSPLPVATENFSTSEFFLEAFEFSFDSIENHSVSFSVCSCISSESFSLLALSSSPLWNSIIASSLLLLVTSSLNKVTLLFSRTLSLQCAVEEGAITSSGTTRQASGLASGTLEIPALAETMSGMSGLLPVGFAMMSELSPTTITLLSESTVRAVLLCPVLRSVSWQYCFSSSSSPSSSISSMALSLSLSLCLSGVFFPSIAPFRCFFS